MKKILLAFMVTSILFSLSACGSKSVSKDLQTKKWNVVSDKGSSATAEFGKDKVTFDIGMMNIGYDYTLKENKLTLENEQGTSVFEIKKDGDEYKLKSADENTKNSFGDLTLSPAK